MAGLCKGGNEPPVSLEANQLVSYSTDKFISYVVPGPLQLLFHFGEEIVIAWTQEKTTTLGGAEPHNSS